MARGRPGPRDPEARGAGPGPEARLLGPISTMWVVPTLLCDRNEQLQKPVFIKNSGMDSPRFSRDLTLQNLRNINLLVIFPILWGVGSKKRQ